MARRSQLRVSRNVKNKYRKLVGPVSPVKSLRAVILKEIRKSKKLKRDLVAKGLGFSNLADWNDCAFYLYHDTKIHEGRLYIVKENTIIDLIWTSTEKLEKLKSHQKYLVRKKAKKAKRRGHDPRLKYREKLIDNQ